MEPSLHEVLEVVAFSAGGYRCAVEAGQVRTQLAVAPAAAAPSAEQRLGLPGGEAPGACRILLMKHPEGDYPVTVSEPVELLGLRVDAIYPLPPLIAARTTLRGLRGLALGAEGVTLLVDFGCS